MCQHVVGDRRRMVWFGHSDVSGAVIISLFLLSFVGAHPARIRNGSITWFGENEEFKNLYTSRADKVAVFCQ